jgi:hypothetical protein
MDGERRLPAAAAFNTQGVSESLAERGAEMWAPGRLDLTGDGFPNL